MPIGDLNKKFGWTWLLIGPLIGLYITSQFNSLGAAYAAVTKEMSIAGQNITLYMGETGIRGANRLLHAHSALLSFLNILYGLSIDSVLLSNRTRKLGSMLAVAGTILLTLGFYFLQVTSLREFGLPFRVLGGLSVVVAIAIMAFGQFKK